MSHKIEVRDATQGAQIVAQGGRLIADYGGYQLYQAPAAAIAGTGENRDEYNFLRLHALTLDTSTAAAQAMRQTVGSFTGKRMHLVQFVGPVQAMWREALVKAGAQIITYVPNNAYLVYGDAQAIAQVQAVATTADYVQWDGAYLNDYRLHPAVKLVDSQGNARTVDTARFGIQLLIDPTENPTTLALVSSLMSAPFVYEDIFQNYHNIVAEVAPENLPSIAARPDVVSIQPYYEPRKHDERQDQIVAGNLVRGVPSSPGYLTWLAANGFTQAQFDASAFLVDVSDSGIDNGTTNPVHPGLYVSGISNGISRVMYARLVGRPNVGSTTEGCDGHGNLNGHIIGGYADQTNGFPFTDSLGYHYGLGVCPFVRLGSSVIFDDSSFTSPNFTTLQSRAYDKGARISNNSWGGGAGGSYDLYAQTFDGLVRDAQPTNAVLSAPGNQEMVMVFSAGNSGPYSISCSSPGIAKNVICVGAADNVQPVGGTNAEDGCLVSDTEATNANNLASFSSQGPTPDGRHKPDLVAPGTHISGGVIQAAGYDPLLGTADPCFNATGVCGGAEIDPTTYSNLWYFPDGQQFYTASSGTSHAAPAVSGACALIRQYFINNYTNPPSPAMTKAYLMNSARYLNGALAADSLWSDAQGMGELDLGMAFDGSARALRDELAQDLLTASGQTLTFSGAIIDSTKPLRITLAWTDAPGSTTASAVYNNDLDLTVTINGLTYKGNVFTGPYSAPGGSADKANNVESVFLPAGLSGRFTLTITAANINSDGVPNNSTPLDQDFALVAYNSLIGTPPSITSIVPTNNMVLMGAPVSFTVTATGTGPALSYQWSTKGVPIPGATNSTYSIAATSPTNTGSYSVVVSNILGTASASATLTVVATVPLGTALDNTSLTWVTDPASPWYGQTNVYHSNGSAGRSYFIGENDQSTLGTAVTGPGAVTFWWKVSSKTNVDFLSVSLNGTVQNQISGEVNWQSQQLYIGSGSNYLEWTYSKGTNGSAGQDAGFVDLVKVSVGGVLPYITAQPASQNVFYHSPASLTVGAQGTPTLHYQWRFNGVNLAGATKSAYTIASASPAQAGVYSVQVANTYGITNSANATLSVVPVAAVGNNDFLQSVVPGSASGAIAIAAGDYHSLTLGPGLQVAAWGDDYNGQCDVPTNLTSVAGIAAGGYFSLALTLNGAVIGWGANDAGQLSPPTAATNLVALAAGESHALALRVDGRVFAWGDNSAGQLNVPANLTNAVAVAAGGNHSLALRTDGTVLAWGDNLDAYGDFVGQSSVPWGLSNVVAIAAGQFHSLAVLQNGSIVAWGDNSQGQSLPPTLTNAVAVAGGSLYSLALKADGTVVGWGNDYSGQYDFSPNLANVLGIATGSAHSLVRVGDTPTAPSMVYPVLSGAQFSVLVQSLAGKHYSLQYKTSLSDASWTTVRTVYGNGSPQFLVDTSASATQRFYRIQQR